MLDSYKNPTFRHNNNIPHHPESGKIMQHINSIMMLYPKPDWMSMTDYIGYLIDTYYEKTPPVVKPHSARKQVELYTDGACLGNPALGGWAFILRSCGKEMKGSDYAKDEMTCTPEITTNNRMEYMGIIKGLEKLTEPCDVRVVTDSKNIVDAFEKGWVYKWKSNGWDCANKDLVSRLYELCQKHNVKFEHIAGHSGHPENEECDKMSRDRAYEIRNRIEGNCPNCGKRLILRNLKHKCPHCTEIFKDVDILKGGYEIIW